MNDLDRLGFGPELRTALDALDDPSLEPARVAAVDRGQHLLLTAEGPTWSTLAGRLAHAAPQERPTVGDWVACRRTFDRAQTVRVLPRRTVLRRKAAGRTAGVQLVAANLDRVFVVAAVGRDLNPRRIERFVTLVRAGGAAPVLVVTKTDLPFDSVETVRAAEEAAPGVPLALVSSRSGAGLDELRAHLFPKETVALVGSSGAGKSSLVNALLGEARQATRDVRAADAKGRHTTTRRELVGLPSGAWLVDTPGIRELGLTGAPEEDVGATFEDVEALAARCRFADCAHAGEPGCAVQEALLAGALPAARLDGYRRLKKEAAYEAHRADLGKAWDTKKRWKAVHKQMRRQRR